jgi:hypothetical protein
MVGTSRAAAIKADKRKIKCSSSKNAETARFGLPVAFPQTEVTVLEGRFDNGRGPEQARTVPNEATARSAP